MKLKFFSMRTTNIWLINYVSIFLMNLDYEHINFYKNNKISCCVYVCVCMWFFCTVWYVCFRCNIFECKLLFYGYYASNNYLASLICEWIVWSTNKHKAQNSFTVLQWQLQSMAFTYKCSANARHHHHCLFICNKREI